MWEKGCSGDYKGYLPSPQFEARGRGEDGELPPSDAQVQPRQHGPLRALLRGDVREGWSHPWAVHCLPKPPLGSVQSKGLPDIELKRAALWQRAEECQRAGRPQLCAGGEVALPRCPLGCSRTGNPGAVQPQPFRALPHKVAPE